MTSPESSPRNSTGSAFQKVADTLYLAALFAAALFLLRLPVFPSTDGGAHLYYSHALDELLQRHSDYLQFYAIRHLFGPYLLHYGALIVLERVVSANLAERIFAALTVLNLGLGVRFLARSLGPNAGLASLLCIPLLLPWEMVAGFMNYCFAVSVSLWCLGFWQRLRGPRAAANFIGFVIGVAVLIISHPVPLLLLIGLCAIDLALIVLERRKQGEALFGGIGFCLVASSVACLAFIVPILIADKSRIAGDALNIGPNLWTLLRFALGYMLSMFAGNSLADYVFRALIVGLLWGSAFLVLHGLRRRAASGLTSADRLCMAALMLLGFSLILPDKMNGSYYFSVRMWWMLWLAVVASVSGVDFQMHMRQAIFAAGCLLTALTAYSAWTLLPPVATRMAVIDAVKLPQGKKGIFLESMPTAEDPITAKLEETNGLSFQVFRWSGARAFMHSDAVLLNSPWMDLTISPLKPVQDSELMINYDTTGMADLPENLASRLNANLVLKRRALEGADFIYLIDPNHARHSLLEDLEHFLGEKSGKWSCQAGSFYALCTKSMPVAGLAEVGMN